jgi:hypothetical protein
VKITAELRWFWRAGDIEFDRAVGAWFSRLGRAQPRETSRTDLYAFDPDQGELGLKIRGGNPGLEIKGLVARLAPITVGPFRGVPELWGKWTSRALSVPPRTIAVHKRRRLRKFAWLERGFEEFNRGAIDEPAPGRGSPASGCDIELTSVEVELAAGLASFWTVGFDAFGSREAVEPILRASLERVVAQAPELAEPLALGYPRFLAQLALA